MEREERSKRRAEEEKGGGSSSKKAAMDSSILEDDLEGSQDSSNHSGPVAGSKKALATDVDDPNTTNIFISNLSPKVRFQSFLLCNDPHTEYIYMNST